MLLPLDAIVANQQESAELSELLRRLHAKKATFASTRAQTCEASESARRDYKVSVNVCELEKQI